jgi:hypothetical protein
MHAYILLDRSGSMGHLWEEALASVNGYVKEMANGDGYATLALFDTVHTEGMKFEVLRNSVPVQNWTPVTDAEATPRGGTPLFDAFGRIVTRAENDNPDKAVIVIMTDGEENQSREMKKEDVKAALDRAEKRGWQVVFLGADFAKFNADADVLGVGVSKRMAMSKGMLSASMTTLAAKSRRYFDAEEAIAFNAEDRAEAGEADVQRRKGA